MSLNTNILFEGMSGRIGNLIYRNRNGKTFVHAYNPGPRKSHPNMIKQQKKFKVMMEFQNLIRSFINQVNPKPHGKIPFYQIFSENIRNAIIGDEMNPQIEYAKVKLSLGSASQATQVEVKSLSKGELLINWDGTQSKLISSVDDIAFVACFCEDLRSWRYQTNLGLRKNKTKTFRVAEFTGKEVHVYFGFFSSRLEQCSDSVYLGKVPVI
jgi:Family of unknown function (DUF6266)